MQKTCQNRTTGSSGTGTTLTGTGTSPSLPVGTGTSLSGTSTTCPLHHGTGTTLWYRYHLRVFCPKMLDFGIFTHFSSTNLLQFVPYQNSTMESTQNNSKCGLKSIKIHFTQVRAFHQNPNQKNEVRVLILLTLSLQVSSYGLLDPLGGRNGKKNPTKATPPCKP